jgi:DNA-binding MarR family transcriptional regulator
MFSLDTSLGFLMNRLANRLRAELAAGFASHGYDITPDQWSILSRLSEQDGISQNELGGRIAKEKTNIARMIEVMERKQLVRRQVSDEDQRQRMVYLTPLGIKTYQNLIPIAQSILDQARQGFTDAEIAYLITMLNQVYENLG